MSCRLSLISIMNSLLCSSQANAFDHMFRHPEGFPAWPLLLPSEKISKVVIVDQVVVSAPGTSPNPAAASSARAVGEPVSQVGQAWPEESELLPGGEPPSPPHLDYSVGSTMDDDGGPPACDTDSSAQSSVTYATVLLCSPKQQLLHLHEKDGSCSSYSDEGNFSGNNSDISASFSGGLDVPRRSCSCYYNSTEELLEKSKHDDGGAEEGKDLYYIGMDYGDDEESEDEPNAKLIQTVALDREGCSVESHHLLTGSACDFPPLYLPQFRTSPELHEAAVG